MMIMVMSYCNDDHGNAEMMIMMIILSQKMTNLAILNLGHNQFEFFPKQALYSNHLTELVLSNNKVT